MNKLEALQRIPLLATLSREEADELCALMELRNVRKAQKILRADEPGLFIMFLVSGRCNVVLSDHQGKEVTVGILEQGEVFGELSVLTGETRSADVEAAEDGMVLVLSKNDFERHIFANSGLMRQMLCDLAARMRETTCKVGSLALLDVYHRVAQTLYQLASPLEGQAGVRVLEQRPTHRELASLAGTSREMVTRALKDLDAAGHISIEGKRVVVRSVPKY